MRIDLPSAVSPPSSPPFLPPERVHPVDSRPALCRHKSILEYFHANHFLDAYNALKSDSGTAYSPDPRSKYSGLLEKKWTSVIRLQKKVRPLASCLTTPVAYGPRRTAQIMDLENRNAALQEELSLTPAKRAALQTDWIPRAPASYTLAGHRGVINKVAFHPLFNLIASASEDATVKIWDWETGEFERTLKGHVRNVNDLDFDSKGNLLGASLLLHPRSSRPSDSANV